MSASDVLRHPTQRPSAAVERGIALLAEGIQLAREFQRDVWDFAVEISELRDLGLTGHDLRWMLCRGYVEQARETFASNAEGRSFRRQRPLALTNRSCFVLTKGGVQFAEQLRSSHWERPPLKSRRKSSGTFDGGVHDVARASAADVAEHGGLHWDAFHCELSCDGRLVKALKVPMPAAEAILSRFQEAGWPHAIPNPFHSVRRDNVKDVAADGIQRLNSNQLNRLVTFTLTDGGTRIQWKLSDGNRNNARGR